MTLLSWFLIFIIFIGLSLLLFFLFYILFPSIKNNQIKNDNPVFAKVEMNYVVPEEDVIPVSDKRAVVLCSSKKKFKTDITLFNKNHSCQVITNSYQSGNDCKFSCIGSGDCVKVCPQNAIVIENNTAVVTNLCIGCGLCINICPKGIIKMVPKNEEQMIVCCNSDNTITSCSQLRKEEKVIRKSKKGFKIWFTCYNIFKRKK
ncbi:MAG: 4Fe-4S binding protein [Treponema sp.]|nr:4Fe-4S binding protein [Treponema sp.]